MARFSASRTNDVVSWGAMSVTRGAMRRPMLPFTLMAPSVREPTSVDAVSVERPTPERPASEGPAPEHGPAEPAGPSWPVEPPPSTWSFGDVGHVDDLDDLVAIGADLEPGTLLAAYRRGLFPMPSGTEGDPMYWFCPVRRGVLTVGGLVVSRSLRRSLRDFEVRVDTAFDDVVAACADPARESGWIDGDIRAAYRRLHELGWAHSVETWRDGRLVGGLYGVAIGGLFAGESMFHTRARRLEGRAGRAGARARRRARAGAGRRRAVVDATPGQPGGRRAAAGDVPAAAAGHLAAPAPGPLHAAPDAEMRHP